MSAPGPVRPSPVLNPALQAAAGKEQGKREKRDVSGWVVLDKPVGMTSTHAVARVKRAFSAKKAGHAGTLDPLASGLLPIALGEATKTVPFVMEGRKRYRFTVRWGVETDTDDAEGRAIATSEARPDGAAVRAALPRFTGAIEQVPPKFSAIKIEGERAYDLARDGETVELSARTVEIHQLALVEIPDADHAVFEAECGKGTYVRALARDLGRTLGSAGHVVALRRTMVGPFSEAEAVGIDELSGYSEAAAAEKVPRPSFLLGVETALQALPALNVSSADASRLVRGQAVLLRGRDAPMIEGWIAISTEGTLIALATAEKGELHPRRIFNLPR
ncbi:MAG: tRNA pseudouridine55 synthase [Hyphomicrobiales bacterium]|jgi:tRNA pseudouridine55 synthase|nr:tRNA pseudouridine55 synthase [Hyphomicrobiales bacterium]